MTIWQHIVLQLNSSIRQAIKNLDESGAKIILIENNNKEFIGTISDGDIRRGLLKGMNMDSNISSVLNQNAFVVPPNLSIDLVKQLMLSNKIQQIPIINEKNRIEGLHLWDEIFLQKKCDNLMVIMAGGEGVRLKPATEKCPKPLLPIAGKPMLQHILEQAKLEGFNHFIIAINYLGHMIEEYFGNGKALDVNIEYIREKSKLGTAGALSLLKPIPSKPFVVTNGDVITDIKYNELMDFHIRNKAFGTMAVSLHEWQHPFGVVETQGIDILGVTEKPLHRSRINAGIYVLEPGAISLLNFSEQCDMPELFLRLIRDSHKTIVYPMHEPWLDVGTPIDLKQAEIKK